ncbi:MAG: hemolysin family protein [Coriobacteriia bacterium]|nr:hemolysin family protein [Coriobacteriia bacterium]
MFSLIAILVSIFAGVIAAIMAASEAAGALLSAGRVLRLVETDRPGADALVTLLSSAHRLRATTAFSAGAAYALVAVSATSILEQRADLDLSIALIVSSLISLSVVFSFAQALPRTVAVQNPESVALTFAPVARRVVAILYHPAKILGSPWRWLMRLVVGDRAMHSAWLTEDDYRAAGPEDEQSVREEAEEALLEAVSDFADKVVREVMVPRTDMTCLPDTASTEEAIEMIRKFGYSRLPVFHETLDDIRGVLYAKDLLAAIMHDRHVLPASLARKPYFVPETKPVKELLIEMRDRTHIAIVADEYGGTAGLVTIEDLLEEIVGEIQDEYDLELPLIVASDNGTYTVDARLPVDDLNELFGTAIESESDTVGGVVIEVGGRIPEVGDEVFIEGLTLRVTELQGTRIRQLVVESAGSDNDKETPYA